MNDGMAALLQHLEVPGGCVMLDSQGGGGIQSLFHVRALLFSAMSQFNAVKIVC